MNCWKRRKAATISATIPMIERMVFKNFMTKTVEGLVSGPLVRLRATRGGQVTLRRRALEPAVAPMAFRPSPQHTGGTAKGAPMSDITVTMIANPDAPAGAAPILSDADADDPRILVTDLGINRGDGIFEVAG